MVKLKDLVKVGLVSLIGLGSSNYVNAQANLDSSIYSNINIQKYEDIPDTIKDSWFNPKYFLSLNRINGKSYKRILEYYGIGNFSIPDSLNNFSEMSLRQLKEDYLVKKDSYKDITVKSICFGDGDNDGTIDYILMESDANPLAIIEQFRINYEKKEVDYSLEFHVLDPYKNKWLGQQKWIAEKVYYNITQKEAQQIGGLFPKRVTKLIEVTNNFGRFNTKPVDKFIREDCSSWQTGLEKGKKGAFLISEGFPFEKYFSDEQIKKINEVLKEGLK